MRMKNMFRIKAGIALLILLPLGFSQSRQLPRRSAGAAPRPPFLEQAKIFEETPLASRLVLKNGMTVLVEEARSSPVVSVQAYVRAGSLQEPAARTGVARLLARMICRREAERKKGSLQQQAYALGGELNSRVDYENSVYEIVAPAGQWKQAMRLQSDSLLRPPLDAEYQAPGMRLLAREAKDFLDDADAASREKVLEMAFDDRRMELYGEMAERAPGAPGIEALAAFHKAHYVPSAMTLVVSGDVRSGEVFNEAARLYGNLSGTAPAEAPAPNESRKGFRYRLVRGNAPLPQVTFGFRGTTENSGDFRALEVLCAVLGLGERSTLKWRLRDQDRVVWDAGSGLLRNRRFGYLFLRVDADPDQIDRSEIAVLTEIELLKRRGPGAAEVARAIAQLEAEHWKNRETASGRAAMLAHNASIGDWRRGERYVAEIRGVKPADVQRAARRYLGLDACTLLEYLPEAAGPRNTTPEGVLQTIEGLLKVSADQVQEKRERETVPFLKIPADGGSFKQSEIQYPFQLASILRGPEMAIREDRTAPLVCMGIYFAGGKSREDGGNGGITRLMTNLVARGSVEMQERWFYHQLEIYGGRLRPVVADDYFGFEFSILSPHFAAGFDLLKRLIKAPEFSPEEVLRQKNMLLRQAVRRRHSRLYARDIARRALFPAFPYGTDGFGTEEGLRALTPDALLEWHSDLVKNRKPYVAIVGDTKGTSLALHFVGEFSGSRMRESVLPDSWAPPVEKGETIREGWRKNQSLILVGFQAPPSDDEDSAAATILAGLAGSPGTLSAQFKDGLGDTVEVSVVYEPKLRGGSLTVAAAGGPENEEAIAAGLKDSIARWAAGPAPSYRDFRSAVQSAAGSNEIRNQGRFIQIRRIVENMLAGKGLRGFRDFGASLEDVGEADLAETARRIFDMDKAVVVRMRAESE